MGRPRLKFLSLLYVSRSTLSEQAAPTAIEDIVATSRIRNSALDVTGAMLFTGEHFAQVLEGPASAVEQVMDKVARDPRHDSIVIVAREQIRVRRFGSWSMAYSGPSQFVSRYVTRLLAEPRPTGKARAAAWLNELLWEFAEGAAAG